MLNEIPAAKFDVPGYFGWDNLLVLSSAFLFVVINQQAFEASVSLILDIPRRRISHYTYIGFQIPTNVIRDLPCWSVVHGIVSL
jgi:hypothetical protein